MPFTVLANAVVEATGGAVVCRALGGMKKLMMEPLTGAEGCLRSFADVSAKNRDSSSSTD
jgi:hypothetical protein